MLDRYALYELCVQSPADLVPLLLAIHGGDPRVLAEDYCGTAAMAAEWVRRVPGGRAIGVDQDPEATARAPRLDGLEVVRGDVVRDTSPDQHRADVAWAGNFSIGECRRRPDLLRYLRHVRSRLDPGGVFVCDLYGGETAFLTGSFERDQPAAEGRVVRYTWDQREADPLSGSVVNALHFQVLHQGRVEQELRDAFVYHWRLWGVPELRDAMLEAGFAATEIYPRVPDALDDEGTAYVSAIQDPAQLEGSFDVLLTARRDAPAGNARG